MTTEQIQLILQSEGYLTSIDRDGDISFKAQGRKLYASVDDEDTDYVRFFLDLLVDTDGKTKTDVFEAANNVVRRLKCVKCMILRQNDEGILLRIAVEGFTDLETLVRNIERFIDIVCSASYDISMALRRNN